MKISELSQHVELVNAIGRTLKQAISEDAIVTLQFSNEFLTIDRAELITSYLDKLTTQKVCKYNFDARRHKITITPIINNPISKEIICSIGNVIYSDKNLSDDTSPLIYCDATQSGIIN